MTASIFILNYYHLLLNEWALQPKETNTFYVLVKNHSVYLGMTYERKYPNE